MPETASTFRLQLGDPAPSFVLNDPTGAPFSLEEIMGEKGVLVVFACNHCPFVVHLAEEMGVLADEIADRGIGTVAIMSNDVENYPADGPKEMVQFAELHGWNFPYLCDEDQEVAKSYSAACTPDFFLFDEEGHLYYAGQFDSSRPRNDESVSGDDIRDAIEGLLEGESPPLDPAPSTGCGIKWKPGNEPNYAK